MVYKIFFDHNDGDENLVGLYCFKGTKETNCNWGFAIFWSYCSGIPGLSKRFRLFAVIFWGGFLIFFLDFNQWIQKQIWKSGVVCHLRNKMEAPS